MTCTKVLAFCAGHRLMGHEGGCAHFHGHNYQAEITATPRDDPNALDAVGRVVDFAVLKTKVGGFLDLVWDHAFLVHEADGAAINALEAFARASGVPQRIVRLPDNPTAENLARHLLTIARQLLADDGVVVVRVRLWETPTCYAEVIRG